MSNTKPVIVDVNVDCLVQKDDRKVLELLRRFRYLYQSVQVARRYDGISFTDAPEGREWALAVYQVPEEQLVTMLFASPLPKFNHILSPSADLSPRSHQLLHIVHQYHLSHIKRLLNRTLPHDD